MRKTVSKESNLHAKIWELQQLLVLGLKSANGAAKMLDKRPSRRLQKYQEKPRKKKRRKRRLPSLILSSSLQLEPEAFSYSTSSYFYLGFVTSQSRDAGQTVAMFLSHAVEKLLLLIDLAHCLISQCLGGLSALAFDRVRCQRSHVYVSIQRITTIRKNPAKTTRVIQQLTDGHNEPTISRRVISWNDEDFLYHCNVNGAYYQQQSSTAFYDSI